MFADFGMIAVDAVEADECKITFVVFGYAYATSMVSPVCRLKRRICVGET